MYVSSKDEAPTLSRGDGLLSTILHSERDGAETDLHSERDGAETDLHSERDGAETDLHSERDGAETDLTITWVEVDPGASQMHHSHQPEQVYVIVAGEGRVSVTGEQRNVEAGDLVHIPSNADHAIENTGEHPLEYVSAATPAFPTEDIEEFYEQ